MGIGEDRTGGGESIQIRSVGLGVAEREIAQTPQPWIHIINADLKDVRIGGRG